MARIRTIKPDFFRHEALYEAERSCGLPLRLAFAGLWTAADREGRFSWRPRTLKLDCLPHDDLDFEAVLNALSEAGFIVKYQLEKGGDQYGYIPSWNQHQHINLREAQSVIPAPPSTEPSEAHASTCTHVDARGERKGKEGKEDNADDARGKGAIMLEGFMLADRLRQALGWDKDDPHAVGMPWVTQKWLNGGWNADLCVATVQQVKARSRKTINTLAYFETAIAEAHARQSVPLPVVILDQTPEVSHVQAGSRHPGGAYGASKDKFRAAYDKLSEFADGGDEPGDSASGQGIVKILPAARRN